MWTSECVATLAKIFAINIVGEDRENVNLYLSPLFPIFSGKERRKKRESVRFLNSRDKSRTGTNGQNDAECDGDFLIGTGSSRYLDSHVESTGANKLTPVSISFREG